MFVNLGEIDCNTCQTGWGVEALVQLPTTLGVQLVEGGEGRENGLQKTEGTVREATLCPLPPPTPQ